MAVACSLGGASAAGRADADEEEAEPSEAAGAQEEAEPSEAAGAQEEARTTDGEAPDEADEGEAQATDAPQATEGEGLTA